MSPARRVFTVGSTALSIAVLAILAGCNKDKPADQSSAPPPPPSAIVAKAGACAAGGGTIDDPVAGGFFPRTLASTSSTPYCIDPEGQTRIYGDKAKLTLEDVCTSAVDGECEVYKRYGLKRFVSMRYVDGAGQGASVEIYLSQYTDDGGAYGMFTKRVIADGDPADPSAPRTIEGGAAAVMGTGRAYVVRGDELAELQYINENESPEQLVKSSDAILAPLAKALGAKLPGSTDKPAAAKALPTASLVAPNAIQYFPKDALGVANVGAGAMGFYKDGDKRWRAADLEKKDADQAKDVMKTLKSRPGSVAIPNLYDEAAHVVLQAAKESPKVEWLFVRKGSQIAAVGDEELALHADDSKEKQAAARLSADDATAKIKAWLGAKP